MRLLLVSNKFKNSAVLEKSTRQDVITVLYNADNSSYDMLLSLVYASLDSKQRVSSIAILVTNQQGSVYLVNTRSCSGFLTPATIFNSKIDPGKFFKILYEVFVDTTLDGRLDIIVPPGSRYDQISEKLEQFLNVQVVFSNGFLGREITNDKLKNKFGSVVDLYFQPDKLKNISASYQTLDLFEKIRMVGKGAFGTAVLYRKKDDNSLVVLKEINMTELNSQERLLAMNEIKILSILNHPNIICYYDTFEENGVLMIEMEYADDGNLSEFLSRQESQLDERSIVVMLMQIIAGVSYIHDQNIIHRDLKTANIFKTKQGCLKIGDFGVSKIITTRFRKANTMIGTPYYISPEICEGLEYDEKSDMWSFGCIMYEMATRQRTFQGSNLPAVVNKIMNGQISRITGNYSAEFRKVVKDLLSKEPEQRPSAHQLEAKRLPDLLLKYGIEEPTKFRVTTDSRFNCDRFKPHSIIGDDSRSVLFLHHLSKMQMSPVQGFLPKTRIRQIAVGKGHTVAIGMERIVYSWGNNSYGQLGHGHQQYVDKPQVVDALNGKSIVIASCGDHFSVFVSDNGIALSCGQGEKGCLGHGDLVNVVRPRLVEGLLSVDVANVSCGSNHVVVLCAEGQLYSWGCGSDGQLGIGSKEAHWSPQPITIHQSIRDIRCSYQSTILITDIGTLLACGENTNNKLGLNERNGFLKLLNHNRIKKMEVDHRKTPTCIKSVKNVLDVRMSLNHTVVLTEPDHVYVLGSNEFGQMASGDNQTHPSPHFIKSLKEYEPLIISCAPTYTVVGTSGSDVLFWGTVPTSVTNLSNKTNNNHTTTSSNFSRDQYLNKDALKWKTSNEKKANCKENYTEDRSSTKITNTCFTPTLILNTFNPDDDTFCDLAVFLDALIPFGDDIYILVETNAPLPKKEAVTSSHQFDLVNSTLSSLNQIVENKQNSEKIVSESTPKWLREEMAEAVKQEKNDGLSQMHQKPFRRNKLYSDKGEVVDNSSSEDLMERSMRHKERFENRIFEIRKDYENKIEQIKEEIRNEKQKNEEKMKEEIDLLRAELSEALSKVQLVADQSNSKKMSQICSLQ